MTILHHTVYTVVAVCIVFFIVCALLCKGLCCDRQRVREPFIYGDPPFRETTAPLLAPINEEDVNNLLC